MPDMIDNFARLESISRAEEMKRAMSIGTSKHVHVHASPDHVALHEFHEIWKELHALDGDKRSAEYKKAAQDIAERLVAKHAEIDQLQSN